jgi:hypothetical protein
VKGHANFSRRAARGRRVNGNEKGRIKLGDSRLNSDDGNGIL